LSFVNHNFDAAGIPETTLGATHKEIDNVETYRKLRKKILLKIYPWCTRVIHTKDVKNNLKEYD
jgi:hypothetical protein